MPLKKTTCYTCSDGKMISDHKEAQRHEIGLEILKTFMDEGYINSGELKRLSLTLANKFEKFSQHFTNIRRINSK